MMYEILLGHTPFYHSDPVTMLKNILTKKVPYNPDGEKIPDEAQEMFDSILLLDPNARPSK